MGADLYLNPPREPSGDSRARQRMRKLEDRVRLLEGVLEDLCDYGERGHDAVDCSLCKSIKDGRRLLAERGQR